MADELGWEAGVRAESRRESRARLDTSRAVNRGPWNVSESLAGCQGRFPHLGGDGSVAINLGGATQVHASPLKRRAYCASKTICALCRSRIWANSGPERIGAD